MSTPNTPQYYLLPDGTECRKFIEGMSYYLGTAFAYLWRAGRKPGEPMVKDLRKALDNIRFELEREEFVQLKQNENYTEAIKQLSFDKFPFNLNKRNVMCNVFLGVIWGNSEVNIIDKREYLEMSASHLTELINSLEAQNE